MHLHILGICGTFMAGIAAIARESGHSVTGSDLNAWPPMSTQLEQLGIAIHRGYDAEALQPEPDVVVVGNVITRGNAAIEHVLDSGLPYVSGPQWLYEHVLRDRHVLAVAGTHGKTTTTSMLAWILECAGLEPGFLIGGVPLDFGLSARLGRGRHFVIEADEYDTAFFDKRSKFVHYRPRTAILNNLEYDHADIFPALAAIERQFHHLVRTIPRSGHLVVNGGDANLARVLEMGCWTPVVRFDAPQGWRVEPGPAPDQFVAIEPDGRAQPVTLDLPGAHNHSNALAAMAAARAVGVTAAESADALRRFRGVRRRLELRGERSGVRVYDDFAHHPTAVAATVEALRDHGPGRVIAILEPRSNTMRLGSHAAALAGSLRKADRVHLFARPDLRWDAGSALAGLEVPWSVHADIEALVDAVIAEVRPGDRLLVMSNGDFAGVHERLLNALDRQ